MEQKVELEKASARRLESQIHRLRNQLERAQDVQREDVSAKSGDTVKRMQKQLRDLRSEVQEAERREQDQGKKRRQAVSGERDSGSQIRRRSAPASLWS